MPSKTASALPKDTTRFAGRSLASGEWFRRIEVAPWLPWSIIAVGVLLRFREYLFDRSMWLDESFLALDIMHISLRQVFRPFANGQAPPVGFAFLEKLVESRLGTSEYAFRLIPFLAGVASLFLFYRVAKQVIAPRAIPIALGLFAISWPLIYYSSETKQYSLDVLVALALYAVALPMVLLEWTFLRLFVLGVFGALAIWFSQPSVFVLGGIGLALAIECALQKRWSRLRSLIVPFSLWAASFGLCYWTVLRFEVRNTALLNYWRDSFAPFPVLSMKDLDWYINNAFQAFSFPAGIAATGFAAALFLIGCAWLYVRRKASLLFLVIPIALTLAASTLHKYPFGSRLILFLAPALILPVAEGVDYVRRKTSSSLIAVSIVAMLFLVPASSAFRDLVKGYTREDIHPVISYIRTHEKPGDVVYLYDWSRFPWSYYAKRENLGRITLVGGTVESLDYGQYAKDVSQLQGHPRVWIVFSHVNPEEGPAAETVFVDLLNHLGKRISFFQAPGASAYLYDLRYTRNHLQYTQAPMPLH
jgi:hypothetical protein